jgi:hypothetical protein
MIKRPVWKDGIIKFVETISEEDFLRMNRLEKRQKGMYETKEVFLQAKSPFSWINALLIEACNVMFVRSCRETTSEWYDGRKLKLLST